MFVGIDLGGTTIKGILTDKNGKEMSYREIPTPASAEDISSGIYSLVENLATSASISKIDILGIGIGSAGSIDRTRGMVIASPNIPSLSKYPLVKNVSKLTDIKHVVLENDATAALIGGWWKGNGTKFRNWIMMTLGTGIGGGVIMDGRIYTGQTGSAMEIGHISIDHNGRDCSCGNKGCLERYASASAMVEETIKRLKKFKKSPLNELHNNGELTAEKIFEHAVKKDPLAQEIFKETGYYLGLGVVSLINIFNPEAIIFGGGLSQGLKLLMPEVEKVVKERAMKGMKESVKLLPIKDQSRIPALGAVKMALDTYREQ